MKLSNLLCRKWQQSTTSMFIFTVSSNYRMLYRIFFTNNSTEMLILGFICVICIAYADTILFNLQNITSTTTQWTRIISMVGDVSVQMMNLVDRNTLYNTPHSKYNLFQLVMLRTQQRIFLSPESLTGATFQKSDGGRIHRLIQYLLLWWTCMASA